MSLQCPTWLPSFSFLKFHSAAAALIAVQIVVSRTVAGSCACSLPTWFLFVQLTAADYAPYAAILASAGYSTVQYDINQALAMVPDREEV